MQYSFNTKQTTFERIVSSPSLLKDFNTFMGNTMGARKYWVDWYPVQSQILDGATLDRPLIVDVGAGKGHDLLAYNNQFPNTGRLVLQDLPEVIEGLGDLDRAIDKVVYDFFTEQPITGKVSSAFPRLLPRCIPFFLRRNREEGRDSYTIY